MTRVSHRTLLSRRRGWLLVAVAATSLLAACQKAPTGQVVATVDGNEITLTELNAELATMQIPPNADKKLVQNAALERIIERKLLANAARQEGLDQNPDFIVRRQQTEDALLVQMLAKKIAGGLKTPGAGEVSKYMADNSNMFAGRTIYAVDQIQFDTPKRPDALKELGAAHSMTDVVAVLDKNGIKYDRGNAQMDSAMVPAPMMAQILKVPAGEPFVVPLGPKVTVSVITGSKPAPMAGDQVRPVAVNAVKNAELGKMLQQRLSTERGKAKIQYQPGFSQPPAAGAAPSPAGSAPAK
ncbi:MAG: EpsD family peptidyl-prolyl cis-trans isomerase [Sphingomonas sp.]|uniref:EpsD family peptidyl-prolyl cis-trans isomerase n=1 Tax=Sphingomonas sp. TaxID=28214 RepID=UPI001AD02476|nr:EpsD family peptidyl-prolyl cis-trans isomerase [Sphingomonas sp.]MBN8814169.1 EpsD family peptidyl-prolyl cis-trans isomerase [Sphingomonas sp.]